MMWIYWVVAGVIIFLVAALTLGREARRLDGIAPRVTYEIDQAVHFVADRIPASTQSRLTHDELKFMISTHLNLLHRCGLMPEGVVDRKQDILKDFVIAEDSLVASLIMVGEQTGLYMIDDLDVAYITASHIQYLRAIGCLGPKVQGLSGRDSGQSETWFS